MCVNFVNDTFEARIMLPTQKQDILWKKFKIGVFQLVSVHAKIPSCVGQSYDKSVILKINSSITLSNAQLPRR